MRWINVVALAGLWLLSGSRGAIARTVNPIVSPAVSPIVGQLLNVHGTVSIRHGAEETPDAAQTCSPIRVGDTIIVAKGGRADVWLRKGGLRFALSESSRSQIKAEAIKGLAGVPPRTLTRIGQSLAQTEPVGTRLAASRIRSDLKGPHDPSPLGLVSTATPTLHWQNGSLAQAAAKMTLSILQGEQFVLTRSLAANTTQFTVPDGLLKPGQWYRWGISVQTPGDSLFCDGPLRVQAAGDKALLAALQQETEAGRKADPTDPTPDVLLAEGCEALGKFTEALTAWRAALAKAPDDEALKAHGDKLDTLVPSEESASQPSAAVQEPPKSEQKPAPPALTPEQQELDQIIKEGLQAYHKADFPTALKLGQAGLEKAQTLKDELRTANFLNNLGLVYQSLGQFDKALDYQNRALTIREKLNNPLDVAASLNNLGNIYGSLARFDKALDYFSRALIVYEKLGKPQAAICLGNLGAVYSGLGQFVKALDRDSRALAIREKLGNPQGIAFSLDSVGTDYRSLGQFDKALDFASRALTIREKLNNPLDIADSLYNLGIVYSGLGQFDKALDYYMRTLTVYEKIGNPHDIAYSLNTLGNVYYHLDQLDKALDYHTRALNLWEKLGNPNDIASSLNNLGLVYSHLDRFDKALDYHRRALAIWEKFGNPDTIATSLDNLGNVYYHLNQFDKALSYHSRALAIREKLGNPDAIADSLVALGNLFARLNRMPEADAAYLRALRLYEGVSQQVTDAGETGAYQEAHQGSLYARYADLKRQENQMGEALELLERGRVQGLAKQATQNRVELDTLLTPEDAAQLRLREEKLKPTERQWQALQQTHAPDVQVAEAKRQYDEAVRQYSAFRNGLFAQPRYVAYSHLQGAKPPTAAQLLEYSRKHADTLYLEYGVLHDKYGVIDDKILLCTLRDGKLTVSALPLAHKALARQIEQWRASLTNPLADTSEKQQASALYTLLLGKADKAGLLQSAKHLVVVADATLLDIPFGALVDASGSRLIAQVPVASAFSLGSLAWKDENRKPTSSLLCYADPFGMESKVANNPAVVQPVVIALRGEEMGPLFAARHEAEALVRQVAGAKAYIGKEATEAAVQHDLSRYALLHFATHGVIDGKHGLLSFLALADGTLNGQEIARMKLSARLATLSACQTARGQHSGGDGLIGLAWAFRAAGVPAIVASQWRVEDEATQQLMVVFYQQLLAHKPKDEALRTAMLAVSKEKAAPYYWAAFQVIGDTAPIKLPAGTRQTAHR